MLYHKLEIDGRILFPNNMHDSYVVLFFFSSMENVMFIFRLTIDNKNYAYKINH